MIEDDEVRLIFKAEFEEYLQQIDSLILRFENSPENISLLQEIARIAHSMKGGARMLGLSEIVKIAHLFEEKIIEISKAKAIVSKERMDKFYEMINVIRSYVLEAVTGVQVQPEVKLLFENLFAKEFSNTKEESAEEIPAADTHVFIPLNSKTELLTAEEKSIDKAPEQSNNTFSKEFSSKRNDNNYTNTFHTDYSSFNIDTIRVPAQKLDLLMNLSGELTGAKIQISGRLSNLEELTPIIEQLNGDVFLSRSILSEISSQIGKTRSRNLIDIYERMKERTEKLSSNLSKLQNSVYDDNSRLDYVTSQMDDTIQHLRMLPLLTIFNLYPRMIRDLSSQMNKQVNLIVTGGNTTADKKILELMKDPIMHLLRNALDHGIETAEKRKLLGKPEIGTIKLSAYQTSSNVVIEISDDGKGIEIEAIKRNAIKRNLFSKEELETFSDRQIYQLIFTPGFSTAQIITDVSGRGVGLDVVQTTVEKLKGNISIESEENIGCTFSISLPLTMTTLRVMIAMSDNRIFALPIDSVIRTVTLTPEQIFLIEGKQTILVNDQPISVMSLDILLELPYTNQTGNGKTAKETLYCIILMVGGEQFGILVDSLVNEQEVIVKPLGSILKRVRNVASSTILGTGEICMILNPNDLLKSVRKLASNVAHLVVNENEKVDKKVILLVEDSITTRTQEKRILESAGYEVITAVDGVDGFQKLFAGDNIDLIISDIQMPNMDGISLTSRIRQERKYSELPIILVTSLSSDEDKKLGLDAGADAYITKGAFDQTILLSTISRLL